MINAVLVAEFLDLLEVNGSDRTRNASSTSRE